MQETTVICDVCGEPIEEPTEIELSGMLVTSKVIACELDDPEKEIEINLEDICIPCSYALESAISDVILRRSPK